MILYSQRDTSENKNKEDENKEDNDMTETRVRLYGRELERWCVEDEKGRSIMRQVEIEYIEYDIETGKVVAVGSEDFSRERYKTILCKMVWTWDGEKRNAGGHRWFEYSKDVKYIKGKGKDVMRYLRNYYKRAGIKDVELR